MDILSNYTRCLYCLGTCIKIILKYITYSGFIKAYRDHRPRTFMNILSNYTSCLYCSGTYTKITLKFISYSVFIKAYRDHTPCIILDVLSKWPNKNIYIQGNSQKRNTSVQLFVKLYTIYPSVQKPLIRSNQNSFSRHTLYIHSILARCKHSKILRLRLMW